MDDVLKILGLAYRARKVVLGEEVLNRIRKVRVMFLASDLSEKSRERFEKKCYFYEIDHIDRYDCEELSKAIGRNNVKVIGITDQGLADSLRSKLQV